MHVPSKCWGVRPIARSSLPARLPTYQVHLALGMPVYWHNRIGLTPLDAVIPNWLERSLRPLARLV